MNVLVLESQRGLGRTLQHACGDCFSGFSVVCPDGNMTVEELAGIARKCGASVIVDCTLDAGFTHVSLELAGAVGAKYICVSELVNLDGSIADCSAVLQDSEIPFVHVRTSWLYGQDETMNSHIDRLADSPMLEMPVDQISAPTYAEDLARMLAHILEKGIPDGRHIFDFCGEGVCSVYDFMKEILYLVGYLTHIVPVRTDAPYLIHPDSRSLKDSYGIEIPHWKESLRMCLLDMGVLPEKCLVL